MKHLSNLELFRYWNERRAARLAPERAEIEPGDIRHVLGDTFVLDGYSGTGPRFRIAGTRLCALFGRELKNESFINLWRAPDQAELCGMINIAMEEKVGMVASITAATADDILLPIRLEMLLLPLAHQSHADARLIGAMAPMVVPYWLGVKAIGPLTLGSFRHVGPTVDAIPAPLFRAQSGRLRHGLTVYDGGRTD